MNADDLNTLDLVYSSLAVADIHVDDVAQAARVDGDIATALTLDDISKTLGRAQYDLFRLHKRLTGKGL